MAKTLILQRGLHKIIQNLFVMKTNPFLSSAKTGKSKKCDPSKAKSPASKSPVSKSSAPKSPPPKSSAVPKGSGDKKSSPPASKAAFWRKMCIFIAFPAVAGMAIMTAVNIKNQPERERPPFVKYEYLAIRHKRFPWGDGDKSLLHNSRVNALPNGYEE